jgi:predicted TIM-barrel fold metal-dependent hydrolase
MLAASFPTELSMTATDVAAFVGEYPYRQISHGTVDWLLSQMDRLGIERAWVGHLPSFLYKDPAQGNKVLEATVARYIDRLLPVPVVHPGLPRWEDDLNRIVTLKAPAIRAYPMQQCLDPAGGEMRVLAAAAAVAGLPLVLTVRFEDSRQRHPLDSVPDLPPAAVRKLVRSDPELRVLVTHADRSFVEEVHFGLAPKESVRVLWDISWIWGAPENHLPQLFGTVGSERFTLGTGMPLRIPDAPFAKLDLMDLSPNNREAVTGGNLERWQQGVG